MMGGEAARLFVTVDAQVNGAVRGLGQVDTAVRKLAGGGSPTITPKVNTTQANSALDGLKSKIAGIAGGKGGAIGQGVIGGLVGGATMALATGGLMALTSAVSGLVTGMVGGASQMEKYTTQLGVLLGGVTQAKQRMAELTEFAKTTPFELPEVVEASKQLQVFTKGALATGEGLRLVGDIASGTGMQFGEAAMWIGRLYDALQTGRPIGEAAMRLQEVGAMSGEARSNLEKLAEQVKKGAISGTDAWKAAAGEFGRYNGMMAKQSETLEGKMSNLSDAFGQMLTKVGTTFLPILKSAVDVLINGLDALQTALGPAATAWDAFWEAAKPPPWVTQSKSWLDLGRLGQPPKMSVPTYEGYKWDPAESNRQSAAEFARREAEAKLQGEKVARAYGAGFNAKLSEAALRAVEISRMIPGAMGEALRSGRTAWMDALSSLNIAITQQMSKGVEVAYLIAALTGKAIKEGLKSGDPSVRKQTEATVGVMLKRLAELQGPAWAASYNWGSGLVGSMAAGMASKAGAVANATKTLADEVEAVKNRVSTTPVTPAKIKTEPIDSFLRDLQNAISRTSSAIGGGGGMAAAIETGLEKAARVAAAKLATIKAQFENFKSFLSIWPRMTAEAITASLDKTMRELAKIWAKLSSMEQMSSIEQAGQEIIRREELAKAPPEVQAVYAEIDAFATSLTAIMKRLNDPKTSEATRKILLARAAEISAEIERHRREAEELQRLFDEAQAAVQANIDAAAEYQSQVDAGTYDSGGGGGGTDYYASGSGSATTNYNIDMDVDFNGPTLDPYGDFATRLAAALIPGLQRELARQGISL